MYGRIDGPSVVDLIIEFDAGHDGRGDEIIETQLRYIFDLEVMQTDRDRDLEADTGSVRVICLADPAG